MDVVIYFHHNCSMNEAIRQPINKYYISIILLPIILPSYTYMWIWYAGTNYLNGF